MPSIGSKTRTVRFSADDLARIEERMKEGETFNGAVHSLISGSTNSLAHEDIEFMASLCDMSMDKVEEEIARLMNDGALMFVGGKLEVDMPDWVKSFEEACHDLCIPVEKAAESAIKALKKG